MEQLEKQFTEDDLYDIYTELRDLFLDLTYGTLSDLLKEDNSGLVAKDILELEELESYLNNEFSKQGELNKEEKKHIIQALNKFKKILEQYDRKLTSNSLSDLKMRTIIKHFAFQEIRTRMKNDREYSRLKEIGISDSSYEKIIFNILDRVSKAMKKEGN